MYVAVLTLVEIVVFCIYIHTAKQVQHDTQYGMLRRFKTMLCIHVGAMNIAS